MEETWIWPVLAALLAASGTFSASETALFSLTPAERASSGRFVRELIAAPRELLATVLLGNLVVNVLFFAFATRMLGGATGSVDLVGYLAALLAVLVAGEILPKTVGLRARVRVAKLGSPPLVLLSRALAPVRRPLIRLLDATCRALGPFARDERALEPEDLAQVIGRVVARGIMHEGEADLMSEILELDAIRVREIMTPRVDTTFLELDGSNREKALASAVEQRLSWLPVVDGNADRVVGRVRVRDLLNEPSRAPSTLVMPVKFVPEVASCLDLLHSLREDRVAEAIVVDEWGGTAGFVTIEDIFEEIVGELRAEGESRELVAVPLGEGRFRVSGALPIRDWNEEFGYRVVPTEFETVGGFVTALLGRIPRTGDLVRYGDLEMRVHDVRGRRVRTVDMAVAAPSLESAGRRLVT